ncbi:MAG: ATP-binding protein [Chloroflexi bacterium]|nr:ATP-binding protein [Chloroflexota bacterium]
MIFDNKSLAQVTEEEIVAVVMEHTRERQHLEFKLTINLSNDDEKREVLLDIASFANSSGGYILIGVRDDGSGQAQRFEPELVGEVGRIAQSVRSLSQDNISERIEGIEIEERVVQGNPIGIIRVPASARRPHMVTYGRRTFFVTRYENGKREMTIGEIREAITEDTLGRRLSRIESAVARLAEDTAREREIRAMAAIAAEGPAAILLSENGEVVATSLRDRFRQEVGQQPYFRIAATPVSPRRTLLNVDATSVRDLLTHPPGSRRNGWNMEVTTARPIRTITGLVIGDKRFEYLELYENGHMEFWSPLGNHFCWRQTPEEFRVHPRLYPYPVVEYPVTFLRLYKPLLVDTGYSEDILVELEYRNVRNYVLRPGIPQDILFDTTRVLPYQEAHLIVPSMRLINTFDADVAAYQAIRLVYAGFQLAEDAIPFYSEKHGFDFPSSLS